MEEMLQHWPFVAAMLVFATFGMVAKRTFFSEYKAKGGGWAWWGRKTLPLHPVAAGMLLAVVPTIPVSPGVEGWSARMLYFAMAGVCSTWAYDVVRAVAKKYDVELSGESARPPPGA